MPFRIDVHTENRNLVEGNIKEYRKKLDAGELISHEWIMQNIFKEFSIGVFTGCNENSIFQFYSTEFIEALAADIKKLNPTKVIEVGAGDGRLSFFLNKHGVNSKPIDNYAWEESDQRKGGRFRNIKYSPEVERIDFREALKKYNPDLVIICWEELNMPYTEEILKYPSVKWIVWIGEPGGCTGVSNLTDKPHEMLKSRMFCLARTDYGGELGCGRHTSVLLFKGEKNGTKKD